MTFCNEVQFPGQGERVQPVITLEVALKLIMWRPGDMAKDYRSRACGILARYLGGDSTLVGEIEANAKSSAPLNVLAWEALQTQRQELEVREIKRIELRERIARIEMLEAEVKRKRVETHRVQEEELGEGQAPDQGLSPARPAARQPDELPAKTTVNCAQLGEGQAPDPGLPPARPTARQPDELPARKTVNGEGQARDQGLPPAARQPD